ncbi:MAG: aspartyl-phosphate phosphatase Spo0E family protein [Bacteroidota bacterium]
MVKKDLKLKKAIDELRQDLVRIADKHGMDSYEALLMSKKLDRLLNIYQNWAIEKKNMF